MEEKRAKLENLTKKLGTKAFAASSKFVSRAGEMTKLVSEKTRLGRQLADLEPRLVDAYAMLRGKAMKNGLDMHHYEQKLVSKLQSLFDRAARRDARHGLSVEAKKPRKVQRSKPSEQEKVGLKRVR